MPIQMKKPSDSSFELTIEDRFDPNEDYVVEVVDMDTGDYVSKLDGKPYTSLHWNYRIYDHEGVVFVDEVSGSPWEGREFSSLSLSARAKGRGWASAFLGHELTDDECDKLADNFDGAIVGKRARVSFKLVEKKDDRGSVLGTNLSWALVRPIPPSRPARPSAPAPQPVVPPTPAANGPGPMPTGPGNGPGRETPAQRRARLEAELAAMNDDAPDQDGDDDRPF